MALTRPQVRCIRGRSHLLQPFHVRYAGRPPWFLFGVRRLEPCRLVAAGNARRCMRTLRHRLGGNNGSLLDYDRARPRNVTVSAVSDERRDA